MARDPQFEHLYTAFEQFKNRCLLQDRSLLWPEKRNWTVENIKALKVRFIDEELFDPNLSFEEKLQQQLRGASPDLWALLADIYYLYFLPSTYITFEKKLRDIGWAAQQAGMQIPPAEATIWEPQRKGCTRTGQRYHQKYMQFWLILLFALKVKESDQPEIVLNNPEKMQAMLDEILNSIRKRDRAYDMRHALLYLAFPDQYERIISTQDKKRIIKTYQDRIPGPVSGDIDESLRRIREALAPKYETEETPFDFYRNVKREWRPATELEEEETTASLPPGEESVEERIDDTGKDPDQLRVQAVLGFTKNVILYGPPGTGKTYIARKVAEALINPQLKKGLAEPAAILRVISDLTFHEVMALSMYLEGEERSYLVPEIYMQRLVSAYFGTKPVKKPNSYIWGYLQAHTDPSSVTVKVVQKSPPFLFDKGVNSRWSLTESGRQYVEENLDEPLKLLKPGETLQPKLEDFVRWVSFHQSYAYEDFIEGLRPTTAGENQGSISYEITPGVFREICTLAKQDPDNKYVLIIDEINRGNIAKILGELITLLEDDKRGNLPVTLPYSKEQFTVPDNLYIIGTMNTADRSIALLDVALRRRFAFVEIAPRLDLLTGIHVETEGPSVALDELLRNLNSAIVHRIDRDHQIGQSYFLRIARVEEEQRLEVLDFIWNNQILPLLHEYFYSQQDKLKEILAPFVTAMEASTEDRDGNLLIGRAHGEDLLDSLSRISG